MEKARQCGDEPRDRDGLARALRYAVEQYEKEAELRRQNERLDEFTSVVSHALRNPLNVATGRLDLARVESDIDHHTVIGEALGRMETPIEDLLTLAQQSQSVAELATVSLESTADSSWRNIDTAEAALVLDTNQRLLADASRLKHLLENQIRTAVEHGVHSVTITIGDLEDGFSIDDDGTGIPDGEHAKIFDGGCTTATDSTGFGRMIVEEIVHAHGWKIRASERERVGWCQIRDHRRQNPVARRLRAITNRVPDPKCVYCSHYNDHDVARLHTQYGGGSTPIGRILRNILPYTRQFSSLPRTNASDRQFRVAGLDCGENAQP